VSVAREVVLEDPIEELGNKIIKEVSGRTADVAGDGTTTATVLAAEIFEGGMTLMREGGNPIHFRDGINHALSLILKEINSFSVRFLIKIRFDINSFLIMLIDKSAPL
jgi:chaperonin GroEL